ncbi:MAG: hypothetical protein JHC84_12675 [Solirubrobacteraceae bacterium]|nr:hypothetical protein [Solirubrobacteraceae bacterium]
MRLPGRVANWGATDAEVARPEPCDRLLPDADIVLHRAVDVAAPVPLVFRWLCQLRAAPYSYDTIDNFGRRSPQELTPGLEDLQPGITFMTFFTLSSFAPGDHVTLWVDGMPGPVAVTYAARPGPRGARIYVRMLWRAPRMPFGAGAAGLFLAAGDLVMMRRQLLNLRDLAERDAARG